MKKQFLIFTLFFACADVWSKISDLNLNFGRSFHTVQWTGIEASLLKESEAKKIFIELASKREMAWDFPNDQCYARAYWTSYLLSRIGIRALSVWGIAPESGPLLRVETLNDPRGCTTWTFHVSSAVVVENAEGQKRLLVIDPAMADTPLELWDWIAAMTWHYPLGTKPIVWASHPYVYRMEDLGEEASNELLRQGNFNSQVLQNYEYLMARNRKYVDTSEFQKKLAELRYFIGIGQNPARMHPNPCPP